MITRSRRSQPTARQTDIGLPRITLEGPPDRRALCFASKSAVQEGFAPEELLFCQRLFADVRVEASRLRQIGLAVGLVAFPLPGEAAIEVRLGVFRVEPDRLAVVGDGKLIVFLVFIGERAIVEDDGEVFSCFLTRLKSAPCSS